MKKLLAFTLILSLVLMLVASMAVPAFAVTPPLQAPDMPEIPDISDDVKVDIPDDYWEEYFEENPIVTPEQIEQAEKPTEPPTEPPAEEPQDPGWCELIVMWCRWFAEAIPRIGRR